MIEWDCLPLIASECFFPVLVIPSLQFEKAILSSRAQKSEALFEAVDRLWGLRAHAAVDIQARAACRTGISSIALLKKSRFDSGKLRFG